MAHVYGHCDFFKNNAWFSQTNRKMMDEMANHGNRIRRYMDRFGVEEVEDVHRRLPEHRRPDRHPLAVHQAPRRRRPATTSRRRRRRGRRRSRRRASSRRTTWTRSSIRRAALAAEADATQAEPRASSEQLPARAAARRDAVPARARAAEAVAARRAVDHPRRGVLLRPAGADQDHERRLGQLLALARS